uniref:Phosphatase and actin regulator n=1 Tax=Seriola lalandi dorsalis TaxID=1841481 RepID=A0A3B4X9P5_SERLL
MPPTPTHPAAFHEQRRSLERARTEDYLKRKIRSRPERSELVRMHILEETSAEPSLQAKQLQLKRARLADDLNDKISHRPGPIELVHKNILSVTCPLQHSLLGGYTHLTTFSLRCNCRGCRRLKQTLKNNNSRRKKLKSCSISSSNSSSSSYSKPNRNSCRPSRS